MSALTTSIHCCSTNVTRPKKEIKAIQIERPEQTQKKINQWQISELMVNTISLGKYKVKSQ